MSHIRDFLREEDGVGVVEIILILVVLIGLVIIFKNQLTSIVGNIFDEHDKVEYNIFKVSDTVYNVRGLTPLSEIEEELGIVYDDEENDTLNGFLVSKLDRSQENDEGTEVLDDNVKYKILSVKDKTIDLVRIELPGRTEQND